MKTLYMLIGPKGAGKTYIGTLLDRETDISFIRVEPIWLNLNPKENGWKKVEETIGTAFVRCDRIMIESLGAGQGFRKFYDSLKSRYILKMVRIFADLDTCLNRVRNRRASDHIPVSDDKVEEYNAIAANVQFDWALEIDNNGPATRSEIVEAFNGLLAKEFQS